MKMGVAAIGALVLVASVNLPAAQGAMWRTGGAYHSWQANRNVQQSWGTPRESKSLWNTDGMTSPAGAGLVVVGRPLTTYEYVLKNRRLTTVVSTYTAVQNQNLVYVRTGYLNGLQDLGGVLRVGTANYPVPTLYPGSVSGPGGAGCVMTMDIAKVSGTRTLGGTTTFSGGSISSVSVTPNPLLFAGTTQLTGSGLLALTNDDRTAPNTFNGGSAGSLIVASVPEPTSVGLLLCGVGGLLRRRRR